VFIFKFEIVKLKIGGFLDAGLLFDFGVE